MSKSPLSSQPASEKAALPLAGRTLVVADDEPDQLNFLATVFENQGATVIEATMATKPWSWSVS